MNYRPEIDGLRAVAVIAVVLYHAEVKWIPGGYVGVDVFFVISGYLITSIIWKECSEDRFSLVRFWERRARRIIPAVTFVVLATVLAGAFLLLPRDFKMLGQSMVAQSAILANFYFWHMAGYFDQASELKPLLHTWSLSVEEQFYLFFPLMLYLLRKYSRRAILVLFGVMFAASFGLSVWQVGSFPSAAFYLLPSRAWELLIGAILALFLNGRSDEPAKKISGLMGFAGAAMIVVAVFCYSAKTTFPGVAAMVPCLGAALIIAGRGSHPVAWLLSTRPMVGIGLVSYSWYLWHWPMLVYMNYWLYEPSVEARLIVVLASLLLAVFSWKWVEQPFRRKENGVTREKIFAVAAACTVLMGGLGLAVHLGEGMPQRFKQDVLVFSNAVDEQSPDRGSLRQENWSGQHKVLSQGEAPRPQVCLMGDSYMEATLHVFKNASKALGLTCVGLTTPGGLHFDRNNRRIRERKGRLLEQSADRIIDQEIPHVVMLYAWSSVNDAAEEAALRKLLRRLTDEGIAVTALVGLPQYDVDIPTELAKSTLSHGRFGHLPMVSEVEIRAKSDLAVSILKEYERRGVVMVDLLHLFTNENGVTQFEKAGRSLYVDKSHLSVFGADQLGPIIKKTLSRSK